MAVRLALVAVALAVVAAVGFVALEGGTPRRLAGGASPTATTSSAEATVSAPISAPSATTEPTPPVRVPLALVTGFSNYRIVAETTAQLRSDLGAGKVVVPCGAEAAIAAALASAEAGWAPCTPADRIASALQPSSTGLALLPAALVTPLVRSVSLDGADLFGETPARSVQYPLVVPAPSGWPSAWTAFDPADVRVVVSTGVNCPDRGVSRMTNVVGKGWDWLLQAGTARYIGRHWDNRLGWYVVDAVRTGHAGALISIIRDADVAVSDFECSMTKAFVQHDSGTVFSIDPRVAPLMSRAGFDVATVAADHNTNVGRGAVVETVDDFAAAGIQSVGGGRDLTQALRPAVIDVRGLKFGFVGFDAIGGSLEATDMLPGVAYYSPLNARTAISAARAAGAQVVFALPQWSSVEYRAAFTSFQEQIEQGLFEAGADHVIGADFHWAGAVSMTPGGTSGYRFAIASQGNFWFGQDWSRQTQEGVMTMLTFVGTRLAQVHLIPTVVLDNAQPNLVDPTTDGQFVLHQVLDASQLPGT